MESYESKRGYGLVLMILTIALYNILILIFLKFTNSYIVANLLKLLLVACNIYQAYYILLFASVKGSIDEENLKIYAIWSLKRVIIPLNEIEGYFMTTGKIKGVKLNGIAASGFVMGRFVIDKIGMSRMFVTDNKNVVYIKTKHMNYAVSPLNYKKFEEDLIYHDIPVAQWKHNVNNSYNLHKDKYFIVPLMVVSIIILILTLNPLILHLKNAIPDIMPLNFDAKFKPIKMGTGKQFAFTQMLYGVLNMALLFCMYYASYFCAKYDRKSAYKYIYLSLVVALIFLIMQFKILINFR
ncbi:PH domain-containing protein [Clostridium estertheticum]|uniref:PH domain-containing protein n=1 Tax=Clostridium estertheticum TaxID=238834 RepID=UPI001C7DBE9E|nr:PH domain-containing protein [Clostridium estertheticum]MBX4258960.1 PH domain-containing protein [Clostridium estertheticum]WLC69041.1 PH domain-containing protein [Clostridium estertheticum]